MEQRLALPRAFPEAVDGSLHLLTAQLDRGQGVGHRQLRVVVGVDAQGNPGERLLDRLDDARQFGGEGAAVGVAQHQAVLGAAAHCGLQESRRHTQGRL